MESRFVWLFLRGPSINKERFVIPIYSLIIQNLNIRGVPHTLSIFHMVTFDIQTLVPWHQFVYRPTLFIQCGRLVIESASFRSPSFAKRLPARRSFIFGKSPMVSGPDCTEDTRRCPNGIAHAARLLADADVHCRATEQFHARVCSSAR